MLILNQFAHSQSLLRAKRESGTSESRPADHSCDAASYLVNIMFKKKNKNIAKDCYFAKIAIV